jgi:hypothetical protein
LPAQCNERTEGGVGEVRCCAAAEKNDDKELRICLSCDEHEYDERD